MPSHLTPDLYERLLRGHLSPRQLLEQAHRHLVELGAAPRPSSGPGASPPDSADPVRDPGGTDLEHRQERWSRIQKERRRARENLRHLRTHPPATWACVVEQAQTRFRTRAFAELLVLESRRVLADDPEEAGHLAALVPVALRWLPGAEDQPWVTELSLRAQVRHAQALHAAGDGQAAARLGQLRRALSTLPEPHASRVRADLDWRPGDPPGDG